MSNPIDRDEAIEAVKTALLSWSSMPQWRDDKIIDVLAELPSAHPELNEWCHDCKEYDPEKGCCPRWGQVIRTALADAQQERLTDDDFETIRIHLSAYKERLCNQHRWKEAEEYQRIIDRFMAFASAQPERKTGKWNTYYHGEEAGRSMFTYSCNQCGYSAPYNLIGGVYKQKEWNFCPNCGAKMEV